MGVVTMGVVTMGVVTMGVVIMTDCLATQVCKEHAQKAHGYLTPTLSCTSFYTKAHDILHQPWISQKINTFLKAVQFL